MFPHLFTANPSLPGMQPQPQDPEDDDDDDPTIWTASKSKSVLQFHGNERTMNINPLILTNVQGSPYFKVELFTIKTFHEVVDQIYYKVDHLEPWATGSRKTAGRSQTGMCGGVRGVSAGGIVSSCFCLLYKLYTLKVTKKQVYALIEHADSPYIRGVGFMYLRYTLPPQLMWDWFEPYLDDEEEIDIKAGGGKPMTIGEMCRLMLTRLEWFDTRFPRIAVNFEKQIRENLEARQREQQEWEKEQGFAQQKPDHSSPGGRSAGRASRDRDSRTREREQRDQKSKDRESKPKDRRSRSRDRRSRSKHRKSRSRDRRSRSRDRRSRSRDRRSRSKDRRSRSKERKSRHRSRSRDKSRDRRDRSRSREKKKEKKRDRSRSRDRHHKKHKKDRSRERRRSTSRSRSRESKQKSKDDDYSQELKKFKDEASKMKKKSKRSRSRS